MATDTDPIRPILTMWPSLNAKLERLAAATCSTKAEILRKEIVLYEPAHQASLTEQRLGVFNEDERLVMEIVGL